MVGDEAAGRNPLLTSIITLAEELEELGLVYANGEEIFLKPYS
jgi:hypothetical protein